MAHVADGYVWLTARCACRRWPLITTWRHDTLLACDRYTSEVGPRPQRSLAAALAEFETTMLQRAERKVRASREAAEFLHSSIAVVEGDYTRAAAARLAAGFHGDGRERGGGHDAAAVGATGGTAAGSTAAAVADD